MYRYRKMFVVTELWAKDRQKTVFTLKQEIVWFKKRRRRKQTY